MSEVPHSEPSGGTRVNSIPVLGEGFSEQSEPISKSTSQSTDSQSQDYDAKTSSRRRFWSLGRKEDTQSASPSGPSTGTPSPAPRNGTQTPSPSRHRGPLGTSSPSSPARMRSPSPASSQIFERNVQEDVLLVASSPSAAAATPAHITTENHIPPALSASANAFADERLSPDRVEIVTLASHQPAAASVTGAVGTDTMDSTQSPDVQDHGHNHGSTATHFPHHHSHDPHLHASPSSTLYTPAQNSSPHSAIPSKFEAADIRRLSFISFADVIHDEHVATDAAHRLASASGGVLSSPSSPLSPPPRSPSPVPASRVGSELSVETMTQALRKTGSGDWETRDVAIEETNGKVSGA